MSIFGYSKYTRSKSLKVDKTIPGPVPVCAFHRVQLVWSYTSAQGRWRSLQAEQAGSSVD